MPSPPGVSARRGSWRRPSDCEHRVVRGDIRRIADERVETAAPERRVPVAQQPIRRGHRARRVRHCRAPPQAPRSRRRCRDAPVRSFRAPARWRWRRSRCPGPRPAPRARHAGRSTRCTNSSVSGRGTSTAGTHGELQRPELAAAQKIGDGHAVGALPARIARSARRPRRGTGSPALASSCERVLRQHAGEQDLRVAALDGARGDCQEPVRCRTGSTHGAAMMHDFRPASVSCRAWTAFGRPVAAAAAAHDGARCWTRRFACFAPASCAACRTPGSRCWCSNCRRCIPRSSHRRAAGARDSVFHGSSATASVFLLSVRAARRHHVAAERAWRRVCGHAFASELATALKRLADRACSPTAVRVRVSAVAASGCGPRCSTACRTTQR